MLPWGHASLGYLCYTLYSRLRYRRPPLGPAVLALAVGTQFPDLIDKPLAWSFSVLPSGRSLAHSLVTLSVVAAVLYWLSRHRSEIREVGAFLAGWTSHVFADGYGVLLGEPGCLNYLLWPLAICPYDEEHRSIIEYLLAIELSDGHWLGIGLTIVAGVVWLLDGAPGVRSLFRGVKRQLG